MTGTGMAHVIDTVWCDFGGVLTPPIPAAVRAIEGASGVSWSVLTAAAERAAAEQGLSGLQPLENGVMSQRDWGRRVTELLPADEQPLVDLGRFGDHWYAGREIDTALVGELERCAGAGMRVGMLTNSVREWETHRDRMLHGVTVFEAVIRSHELGFGKPDPRIYRYADVRLPPGRGAVLIDDSPVNIAAARVHGWHGVTHRDTASTVRELARLRAARCETEARLNRRPGRRPGDV
ncbi:hypothetical protein GCM10027416_27190 [Okibacterium endophyticum]